MTNDIPVDPYPRERPRLTVFAAACALEMAYVNGDGNLGEKQAAILVYQLHEALYEQRGIGDVTPRFRRIAWDIVNLHKAGDIPEDLFEEMSQELEVIARAREAGRTEPRVKTPTVRIDDSKTELTIEDDDSVTVIRTPRRSSLYERARAVRGKDSGMGL